MIVREPSWSHRVEGSVTLKCGLALCGCLLAALLLADLLSRSRPEQRPDAPDWGLTDILGRLERRGLPLRVVPTARPGWPCESVYLTEAPDLTWEGMQRRPRAVEHIDQWRGTAWGGRAYNRTDAEDQLAAWGPHGCRIGDLIHDRAGRALDGDGTPGGDRAELFFRLFGDSDGDLDVDDADLAAFAGAYGSSAGDEGFLGYFDADGGGVIDKPDLAAFAFWYFFFRKP